jgi:hypothetical protein
VTESPDPRIADLFARYWDDALTPAERDELAARLAGDPVAREEFQAFLVQAVAAAEASPAAPARPARSGWVSRRQLLWLAGGGVAAGAAAVILGPRLWPGPPPVGVELIEVVGEVTLKTPNWERAAAAGPIPVGTVVTTVGPSSSALLRLADGTDVSLAGESVVVLAREGHRLQLQRGTATASAPAHSAGPEATTLGTTEATVSGMAGAVLTLARAQQTTEVGVQSGRAAVADAAGDPLEVVHPGEVLIVRSDGRHRKQPVDPPKEAFAWDLTRPLPEGWAVGVREVTADGPVVRPVRWFDPYHKAEMYQIRSDHQWARAFAKLLPGSTFRVRYRVNKAGPGQLTVIARKDDLCQSDTGVVEWNGAFQPGGWRWLDVKAGAMLDNKHAPRFGPPWVAFLIIFNTYREDLGLEIAAFQVIPPGPAPG